MRLTALVALLAGSSFAVAQERFPRFEAQEIAADLTIGYAVLVADIDGDGKPDIVVVDRHRVVWYQNPTWKVRTILAGKTKPDNVCVAALDIDGGGDLELVVGAGWKPFDTQTAGTLQWLKRGKTLDEEWTLHAIPCDEPTVHRVAVADMDGDGKPDLVVAPLMGRGSTAKANWADGRPSRVVAYAIPRDPVKGPWEAKVVTDELRVVHNIFAPAAGPKVPPVFFAASYEGVTEFRRGEGFAWRSEATRTRGGDQSNPKGSRGTSELAVARVNGSDWVAAVEPWHGNTFVLYRPGERGASVRTVLDDHLRWGHAVKLVDLDGDGVPEVIAGVRDDANPKAGDTFAERRGVRVYRTPDRGRSWERHVLEDGGVAVEDLAVADLNGDGRPDIVAVGRATGNCRIYWNRGK